MIARIVLVFSLFWATPLRAEMSCLDVFALTRLLDVSQTTGQNIRSIGNLMSDIHQLDRPLIDDGRTQGQTRTLSHFAALADQMAKNANDGNIAAVLTLLRDPANVRTIINTMDVLVAQGCDEVLTAAPGAGDPGPDRRTSASDITAPAIQNRFGSSDVVRVSLFTVVSLFAIAASVWIGRLLMRYRRTLRRRGKRYMCSVATRLSYVDRTFDGTLIDISCYGGKLAHKGRIHAQIGDPITAVIAGKPRAAKVAWINDHYLGINFNNRLGLFTVLDIAGRGSKARGTKKRRSEAPSSVSQN